MITSVVKDNSDNTENFTGIHPVKFVLWLLIVASVMLFAAFTSAYIVRRGEGNWLIFDLPSMFIFTTIAIGVGSVFMQMAYQAAKKDELENLKKYLFVTLFAGLFFAAGQFIGWTQLVANNIHLVGNPSESFVYIISGLHLVHMFAAIIFVVVIIFKTYNLTIHRKNLLPINLCTTLWHFLGAMWMYLYFFLLLNR